MNWKHPSCGHLWLLSSFIASTANTSIANKSDGIIFGNYPRTKKKNQAKAVVTEL